MGIVTFDWHYITIWTMCLNIVKFPFSFALQRCFICWNERIFLHQMSYRFFLKKRAAIMVILSPWMTPDVIQPPVIPVTVQLATWLLVFSVGEGAIKRKLPGFIPFAMMTSSNWNIFRVTGRLCGEFTGHRWIPLTKASNAELCCFLWSSPWINGWVNNRGAGYLRRHRAHYDAIVMMYMITLNTLLATSGTTSIA